MTVSKLRNKLFACLIGMLAGASSFLSLAQVPGPVNLRGLGGDTIQELTIPVYGTGGTIQIMDVPAVGTCSNCFTYSMGAYVVHAFTVTGATHTFTPPTGLNQVDILLVGGGGGGGGDQYGAGGGGAGGVRALSNQAVTPLTPIDVIVGVGGAGGAASNGKGADGSDSSFGAESAIGGGGGGAGNQASNSATGDGNGGGSGGGGGARDTNAGNIKTGGTGTVGQGNNGADGTRTNTDNDNRGGGGGGAGAAGDTGVGGTGATSRGGNGGNGADYSATYGPHVGDGGWFGGGGGGGKRTGGTGGAPNATANTSGGRGGQGGGGNGGSNTVGAGVAALPNTGGGGGGSGGAVDAAGGGGGSGIVLVRYIPPASGVQRVVHTFAAGGTFTPPEGLTSVDVLVVGGGGAGGNTTTDAATRGSGGGGAGRYRHVSSHTVTPSTPYTVTVGAGGSAAGGTMAARTGGNSVFNTITAEGGGAGGSDGISNNGANGGSGGGSRQGGTVGTGSGGGTGSNGGGSSTTSGGGGGGGPATVGNTGTSQTGTVPGRGGVGGWGTMNVISGAPVTYAGGGGGGAYGTFISTSGGAGGPGGGGGGANSTGTTNRATGTTGTANTGGGGGGASGSSGTQATNFSGGSGGSGVVIISYVAPTFTYVVHTFSSTGTTQFTPPPGVTDVDILVVGAGGGGGRGSASSVGGGGGGGAVVQQLGVAVTPNTALNVTVGVGGTGATTTNTAGGTGNPSTFASPTPVTAAGGGGGGAGNGDGQPGASGGGAGANDLTFRMGGTASAGFNGGNNFLSGVFATRGGGGGGGAGALGTTAASGAGGAGGAGVSNSLSGTAVAYGGGGGGSGGTSGGAGGTGGGASGGAGGGGAPGTATANLGGGGGGAANVNASSGGSGVVIVRYRPPTMTITQQPSATVDTAVAFPTQPQVTLLTAAGAAINSVNVTAAIDTGTGTLGGTTTIATTGGVASFSNLSLTGTAGNFRLAFTASNSTGQTVSNDIDLQNYQIKILHGSDYALCTPSTTVTLEIRRTNGTLATNFAGTVTLTNNGPHGDYTLNNGANPGGFNNGTAGDGIMSYTFVAGDGGDAVFNFTTATAGNITFDATGPNSIADDNTNGVLAVAACHFRFTHDLGGTTCAPDTITLGVHNASGALVTGYTGSVTLSTSTNQGVWTNNDGVGTFTPGGGNGGATYTFAGGDAGNVVLNFLHPVAGTVNFNALSGAIVEAPGFDANLIVTACDGSPVLQAQQCYSSDTGNIAINAQTSYSERLVVLVTSRGGAIAGGGAPATTATYNGQAMSAINSAYNNAGGNDVMTEMFAMTETTSPALPAGAGNYAAAITAGLGTTRICLFYFENMVQTLPTAPATNATSSNSTGTTVSTDITTQANNAYALSAVTASGDAVYSGATAPLTTRLHSINETSGTTFAISSGIIASAGNITATETSDVSTSRQTHVVASFAPAPAQLSAFRITHAGTGGTCAPNTVTITAIDQYGATVTSFTGTVTLSTSGGLGDWAASTGLGTLNNGAVNDGAATYTFAASDNGQAALSFSRTTTSAGVNFGVTNGTVNESPFYDADLALVSCSFRISHAGTGSTCAPNTVTIGIYLPNGSVATSFTGTVNLTASGALGDWAAGTGLGALNNGTANDGAATYTFVAGDNGVAALRFSRTSTAASVNFGTTSGSIVEDVAYDPNMNIQACLYRISHDASGDICTPEAITITVVNTSGVTQTNYTGTVNITTATSVGDWAKPLSANGTLNNLGSGAANYTFAAADNGVATLNLTHHSTSAGVNINLNSGAFQEDPAYDPALVVAACKIRFSLSNPNVSTCSTVTVTVGIYNSGGTLATNYTGDVSLTTSTAHGTWVSSPGPGTLVDNNPGDGTGTYTFVAGDAGDATIVFSSTFIETLNFNATANSGAIVVDTGDPAYDPDLNVTACLPTVTASACYANQSQANAITLLASTATSASRMVLLYVNSESTTAATGATINGVAMTLLRTETETSGTGQILQVYGLLDANLPAAAGTYDAAFTGSANTPAMCIVAVRGVAQSFPTTGSPASSGQLNGNNVANANPVTTNVTTLQNNSLIVSVVANGQDGTTYTSNLATQLWQAGVADAASSDWSGHHGYQLAAGLVFATDTASVTPNRQVQIALALAPIVSGPPAVTGYVPVTLYKTYSGNVDFVSVGNTLRQSSVSACLMEPVGTGTTATVNLPASSTIKAAYLYWAGSGFEAQRDTNIRFGVDTLPGPDTRSYYDADEYFIIAPNQVYNEAYPAVPEGFFAAYKDVTSLVSNATTTTYRFSDLAVQTGAPWSTYSTCVGGWSLVVVYENSAEDLNVINLFHGFQPFWHSGFTLVPRNFRMATPDGVDIPHAQVTHVTFEGDPNITGADEVLGLQNDPANQTFTPLTNVVNTNNNQYNSTISIPNYDGSLNFTGTYTTSTTSHGTDIDTYYVEGDTSGEIMYPFGALEAEQITTRYATAQDIVLLVGEFISVTNAPIADLEVFLSSAGTWKVGASGTGTYTYQVKNNGNGAVTSGFASGDLILTGNMPTGITIASISASGWDCTLATATAFTCIFDIVGANVAPVLDDELDKDEFTPDVVVTVNIGSDAVFPLLDNDTTSVARVAHVGNYYLASCQGQGAAAGVQPNPNPATGCTKAPQFDNVNDLNKYLVDIDDLNEKSGTNNNVHKHNRNVRGIETNLSMTKTLSGTLEANNPATYQLSVSNLGPDATTKTVTVTDTLPAGLVPQTAVGTNWSCNIAGQLVTCTRTNAFPIANGGTAPAITITTANIASPAVEGAYVSNTATVAAGQYNFDTTAGNNSSTTINQVTGPLAASTEKFLLSVTENGSTIGGLTFDAGDLVVYDPINNTAEMYLDESDLANTSLGNVDALHLLPNGHIILSTATDGSTLLGVTFNAEDLILYDPIVQTGTLIFDGSVIFTSDTVDVDSVHVLYNNSYTVNDWDIILSTTGTATIGALTFQHNDIVSYDVSATTASVLEDGASNSLFGNDTDGNISALYRRYDSTEKYFISSDATTTIALSGEQQQFERGEVVEIDLTTAMPPTDPRFCDNVAPCVGSPVAAIFTPASATRRLDALHVIESGYFGHFAVTSVGGDTCSATAITLRKHAGLTHTTEAHYQGTVIVSNNLAQGTWAKDATANGTITNLGSGVARYTFAPGDNGQVILYITGTSATNSFNVNVRSNVSNRFTVTTENSPTEDPNIVINNQVTAITYLDQFGAASYNNNNGVAGFATAWTETNDDNSPTSGKFQISGGELWLNNQGGGAPTLMRQMDFSGYTVSQTPALSFQFNKENAPSHQMVVQVRGNSGDVWTTLDTLTNATSAGAKSYPFTGITLSSTTQIRFTMTGASANSLERFKVDNVQVSTQTTDCNVGSTVDHYAVSHDGSMVSCLVEMITITPHSASHVAVQPGGGVVVTLQTSTNKGYWGPPTNGSGTFTTPATDNGFATYAYLLGESSLTFPFYYTELTGDSQVIQIQVSDNDVPANIAQENSNLTVSRTGLRFYNETTASEEFPTMVAGMPSNLSSNNVLTVQAVRTSDNNPGVCEAAFPNGTDAQIELAFECGDPSTCSAATIPMQVTNNSSTVNVEPVDSNGGTGVSGGWVSMPLRFTTNGTFSRAQLVLNYGDAGSVQIHGRHNLRVQNQAGTLIDSNDYMSGSGDTFVVRPFGFDIDFSQDRFNNGNDNDAISWAADVNGSVFFTAGSGFNTTVRAIAWQAADDANTDGVPDIGADLFNNPITPNFGNEAAAAQDDLTVTHTLAAVMPMGSVNGSLSTPTFTDLINGTQMHTMAYSEVGIINLTATLDSLDYLGGGQGVAGNVRNVGRFRPADFLLTSPTLTGRPLFTPSASSFTYMGEEFTGAFTLTARNALGATTQNYFGAFSKLTTPAQLTFYAIDDVTSGDDINYSARLSQILAGYNPWPANYQSSWAAGQVLLDGNLIFARLANGTPDGPFAGTQIAVAVQDSDGVVDASRDVDDDDGVTEPGAMLARKLGELEFRYGRIRLENGYGTDIADVDDMSNPRGRDVTVALVAEYFNGTRFVPNVLDVATNYTSAALSFVPLSYTDNLDANEAIITTISGKVYQGLTRETAGQTDPPLFLRAPLASGNAGGAVLELDLDYDLDAGAGVKTLNFLKFDWRDPGELEDVKADSDSFTTPDNPRALIEFGTFRGNDRIINWQEIFE